MYQDRVPSAFQAIPASVEQRRRVWAALLPRRSRAAFRFALSAALALADLLTIALLGLCIEATYYYVAYTGEILHLSMSLSLQLSALIGTIILLTNVIRESYNIETYLARAPQRRRTATLWVMAWAAALLIGFATKTTDSFSRVVTVLFFVMGLPAILLVRIGMVRLVKSCTRSSSVSVSRVHLVGYEEDIARFYENNDAEVLGLRVIGTSYLRHAEADADEAARTALLVEDLGLAVSVVRFLRPDDVFVLVPWAETADVERCIDAFLRVPAALHLRPGTMLDRFPDLQIARVGRLSGLNIGRRPLNLLEILIKRVFDFVLALVALLLLAPLFAAIAVLIKLDDPAGPVFYRQRRYGFNQQAFGVFKFRSMRHEANAVFRQATRDDDRITRIGAVLRRTNIDELPQLINVVLGEMSLVGPRPHAVAHDRSFEDRIALYARRHNVKPGITGWAQVNGFRGETLTDEAMEKRVQADLHYIDNWSLWLDVTIMVQTVISPRAYSNAY